MVDFALSSIVRSIGVSRYTCYKTIHTHIYMHLQCMQWSITMKCNTW